MLFRNVSPINATNVPDTPSSVFDSDPPTAHHVVTSDTDDRERHNTARAEREREVTNRQ